VHGVTANLASSLLLISAWLIKQRKVKKKHAMCGNVEDRNLLPLSGQQK